MKEERDSQRGKLYKAECAALTPFQETYPEMEDVNLYVARTVERAPIKARYGAAFAKRRLQVKDGRGRWRAGGCAQYITIPRHNRLNWVILHELAHTLTQRIHGHYVAAHGWQFAAIYIDLVHFMMGKAAADALKAAFREHHVRWKPKAKRVATPEQLERLAAARAARTLTKIAEAA